MLRSERTDSGVRGLAEEAAEGGDRGLAPEDNGLNMFGEVGSGGLPVISANSAGVGFHELRWKLFFLRTLALYAWRMTLVAWDGLMKHEDVADAAELMLGVRPFELAEDVVISRRGNEGGTTTVSSRRGEDGEDGEDEVQVS